MRILVLAPFPPWPPDGGRIRIAELVRGLAGVHDVSLLALGEGTPGEDDRASLESAGVDVEIVPGRPDRRAAAADAVLRRRSLHASLVRSSRFRRRLDARLAEDPVDVIQCEYSTMAQYLGTGKRVPWVLDAHNVEFRVSDSLSDASRTTRTYRWYARRESRLRRREEVAAWRAADGIATVSDVDREIVAGLAPGSTPMVVPNGVDLDRLRPGPTPHDRRSGAVFVGKMDYRPNTDAVCWFVDDVLPLVRRQVPTFTLTVVGRNVSPAVLALSTRPGVVITGAVDDPVPYVQEAALAVVPLRAGSGSRLKVLEAFALGTPVVSTTQGAEGIELRAGHHAVLADGPADLAAAVVDLLATPSRREELARAGRRLVEDRYGWAPAVHVLCALHQRVVNDRRAASRG